MNQFTQGCILNRHEDLEKLERYLENKAITHEQVMWAIGILKEGKELPIKTPVYASDYFNRQHLGAKL